MWLPLTWPPVGTWPATQACALTGNGTSDPLVCRPALNPLSHTSQGSYFFFFLKQQNPFWIYTQLSKYKKCKITDSLLFPFVLVRVRTLPKQIENSDLKGSVRVSLPLLSRRSITLYQNHPMRP